MLNIPLVAVTLKALVPGVEATKEGALDAPKFIEGVDEGALKLNPPGFGGTDPNWNGAAAPPAGLGALLPPNEKPALCVWFPPKVNVLLFTLLLPLGAPKTGAVELGVANVDALF